MSLFLPPYNDIIGSWVWVSSGKYQIEYMEVLAYALSDEEIAAQNFQIIENEVKRKQFRKDKPYLSMLHHVVGSWWLMYEVCTHERNSEGKRIIERSMFHIFAPDKVKVSALHRVIENTLIVHECDVDEVKDLLIDRIAFEEL